MGARSRRAAPRRCARTRGFTLVELLIALVLVSFITLILFSALRLATRAWDGVDRASEHTAELRIARGFIERMLAQLRPTRVMVDAQEVEVFSGTADGIELVAPLSEHVGISGLYVLRLTLSEQGEQSNLILTRWLLHPEVLEGGDGVPEWTPFDGDREAFSGDELDDQDTASGSFGRTLLLVDVDAFEIAYFGIAEGEQDGEWFDEWLEQPRLPLLIRLRLTTRSQSWPDSQIAVAVADETDR